MGAASSLCNMLFYNKNLRLCDCPRAERVAPGAGGAKGVTYKPTAQSPLTEVRNIG